MKLWIRLAGLGGSVILIAMSSSYQNAARAQSSVCTLRGELSPSSRTAKAISQWQDERRVGLTPSALADLTKKFCSGATEVSNNLGIPLSDIDSRSGPIVRKYLDDNLANSSTIAPLAPRIASEFSLGASPSIPEPKMLGTLKITYSQKVDTLRIGASEVRPWPVLLVEIGSKTIMGLLSNHVVCQGSLAVDVYPSSEFVC